MPYARYNTSEVKATSYQGRVHVYNFESHNLADAMAQAAHWLRNNDDPVNVTVTVTTKPRPMTLMVDWEVKVVGWF